MMGLLVIKDPFPNLACFKARHFVLEAIQCKSGLGVRGRHMGQLDHPNVSLWAVFFSLVLLPTFRLLVHQEEPVFYGPANVSATGPGSC